MSRDGDAHSDGVYSDQTTDGPYNDADGRGETRGTAAVPYGSAYTPGWWPLRSGDEAESEYGDDGDPRSETRPRTNDDGRVSEEVVSLLLIVGVVLFLVPEPVTSTVGIVLVAAGAIAWIVDALG